MPSSMPTGYNILGDGTPQQLIPMLTGLKETELPSTLHRETNGSFVDVYPFIWNQYRQQGYVTGYAEDRVEYGIWTLRLKGFNRTPTDHYLPPFYRMESTRSLLYTYDAHCLRNQTSFDVFLSYIEQFWSAYATNNKFFFGFFKQYTHDGYAAGSLLDGGLLAFLQRFNATSDHRRTIVVLMTDHGARFSQARQTPQGKLEERLPFMSWILPKAFREKYPHAVDVLKANVDRLTTPFDVHATLQSLLDMKTLDSKAPSGSKQRHRSLFTPIPSQRTCDDIDLEPHWCSCLQWSSIPVNATRVKQALVHVIGYINQHLESVTHHPCARLRFHSISSAQMHEPNQALLTFSQTIDLDGRIAEYNDVATNITFYQLTFRSQPNDAIYEVTTQYSTMLGGFVTDLDHISRLNAYKGSAACVERTYPHLRKFCHCIR